MYQPDLLSWQEGSHEEPTFEGLEAPDLQADNEPTVVPWVTYLHAPSSNQANGHTSRELVHNAPAENQAPQTPDSPPFWRLAARPTRPTRPNRFPFSTHQPPLALSEGEETTTVTDCLVSMSDLQSIGPTHMRSEIDTMSAWNPQDRYYRSQWDNIPGLTTSIPAIIHVTSPGHFVASQGDALLLNTMDQHRSAAHEWMDLLQQEPAVDQQDDMEDTGDEQWDDCEFDYYGTDTGSLSMSRTQNGTGP